VRENEPSLFDLLLEENSPWEAVDTEQQLQAIDVLARLIANAAKEERIGVFRRLKPSISRSMAFSPIPLLGNVVFEGVFVQHEYCPGVGLAGRLKGLG